MTRDKWLAFALRLGVMAGGSLIARDIVHRRWALACVVVFVVGCSYTAGLIDGERK